MTDAILQAYREVEQAMARYNKVLEEHVTTLRTSEAADARKLERMTHGAKAMRDSSMIYLSYAKFIAYGMPESEELIEEDLQG
jgi:ABC-type transport system involved in Fe-S cluster assembly fused permease/ATPase subunit